MCGSDWIGSSFIFEHKGQSSLLLDVATLTLARPFPIIAGPLVPTAKATSSNNDHRAIATS